MKSVCITESTKKGDITTDLNSRLFADRMIFLSEDINDYTAQIIIQEMLYLEAKDSEKDIWFYINSPGGEVDAGLAIYDTMQTIKPDVRTYGIGKAASMASLLLACGAKGKRYVYPNCEVLVHQPLGGMQGQASDLQIAANHIKSTKRNIAKIFSEKTNKNIDRITNDMDRDNWFTAKGAVKYGLADHVFVGKTKIKEERNNC